MPELVGPYAKMRPFWPSKRPLTSGCAVALYRSACFVSGPNTCENL